MTKVLLAVPTYENVTTETFKSIFDLEKIPGVDFELRFVKGYGAARARNLIAKIGQNEKFDYIIMIDSDIVLPKNALIEFSKWGDFDFIAGYYPRKDDASITEVYKCGFGYPKENRITVDELKNSQADLIEIQGCGFGCVRIKTSLLDKLEYPYFKYVEYPDGDILSEDLYFCDKVIKTRTHLYLNPKIGCWHVGKKVVRV